MPDVTIQLPPSATLPDAAGLMAEIAAELEYRIKVERFGTGGNGEWPPKWTIPGMLSDLDKGPNVRDRADAQTGVDTGRLRDSITARSDSTGLEVSAGVEYARQFHEGGKRAIRFTAAMARNLREWYRRGAGKRTVQQQIAGWLFRLRDGDMVEFNQRPRPIVTDADVVKAIRDVVEQ